MCNFAANNCLREFFWCIIKIPWLIKQVHAFVVILEPWGILIAAIGLTVSIVSFQFEFHDRSVGRRLQAWEIISADGPYSGGKAEAAEFLLRLGNDLSGAKLSGSSWEGRQLSNTNFQRAALNGAVFYRAKLTKTDFRGATLRGSSFFSANLEEAVLRNADLTGAKLIKANLKRADFFQAKFKNADLMNADLSQANLKMADLRGAKNLDQHQLAEACGDEETKLDHGLVIPLCFEIDWFVKVHGNE